MKTFKIVLFIGALCAFISLTYWNSKRTLLSMDKNAAGR